MSNEPLDRQTLEWISTEILPHEGDVRAWLRRAAPADLEANDIIQESYSRIARLHHTDQIRSGRAYFFTVARNIVREHFRRKRVVRIEPLAEMEQLSIVDDGPSAERILTARQEFRIVWRLMDQLPDRCRRIFLLRKIDGLSQKEIAQRVGVSENVVQKQIALGLQLLLRLLAEETLSQAAGRADEPAKTNGRKLKR